MSDGLERLVEELEQRRAGGGTPECLSDPALEAIADGTAPATAVAAAGRHLATCLECLQAYATLRALLEASSPEITPAETEAPEVDRRPRRLAGWLRRPRSLKLAAGWALAGATAAVLLAWAITPHVSRETQELGRVRAAVKEGREAAVRAEADRLAKDVLEQARAKEAQADALAAREGFAAAVAAYREAVAQYAEALRRVEAERQARAEADQARIRMRVEKGRARSDASLFKGGLAAEQQGDSAYQRQAFGEAAGYYQAAQDMFAKVAPPAPTSPQPRESDAQPEIRAVLAEIRAVLAAYERAVATKDLALFRQVRPDLSDAELGRARAAFAAIKSQTVALRVEAIEISGDEARARGMRRDVLVLQDGRTIKNEAPFAFTLRRFPNGWAIAGMN